MEKITLLSSENVEMVYASINQACRENGATSGMNRENAIKFLEKRGFKIKSIEKSQSETGIIEKLIKLTSKTDKTEIENLETQLAKEIENLKMGSDISKIVELKTKIENARKPKSDIENILAKVREMYNEYSKTENE